jgi:hypothetical protein
MRTGNFCFYLQSRLIQTRQTGGQRYSDTSSFSILWFPPHLIFGPALLDPGVDEQQRDDAIDLDQCYKTFYDRKLLISVVAREFVPGTRVGSG